MSVVVQESSPSPGLASMGACPRGKGFFFPCPLCLLGLEGLREVDGLEVFGFLIC